MKYSGTALDVLTSARDIFSRKGFSAATTREIALDAGVNELTLFRQFKSKTRLFEAVFEHFYFHPNFNNLRELQCDRLYEYLQMVGIFMHGILLNNLNLIVIEMKEHNMMKVKSITDRFRVEIKEILKDHLIEKYRFQKSDAEVFIVTCLSSVMGIFLNIYVLKTFKTKETFEDCLNELLKSFLRP